MFTFSGKPWLSQKWMRTICNEFYGTEGVQGYGHGQDEDQRQLGAWHVMAAMGLSDVKGLTASEPSLQIVSHLFDKMTVRLDRDYFPGKEFVIKTNGNSIDNIYMYPEQGSMGRNFTPCNCHGLLLPVEECLNLTWLLFRTNHRTSRLFRIFALFLQDYIFSCTSCMGENH